MPTFRQDPKLGTMVPLMKTDDYNDQSVTEKKLKDGAVTNSKLAEKSVGNSNLQDGSVSNEKLADGSVTNEKIAGSSITKDKLKDNTIGVEKLDPELRQTIEAATGLPENLVETIQNVDDTLKDHQRQIDDKQSQIDDKQQQITANDEDISLLQTRSTQMEETIKGIAATGGASQATAVTYNNEKSKLTAVNIQSAVDEVVDKVTIKDEEGTLVETPFRYIQNEEFIFAKVDAEDKLLFGIQWDGTPVFGKTSAVEDRLQSQVTLLAERVATIMGDDDTTNIIDTMNELKKFFAEIENTQTLTSILANLDKTTIKDEEGNVQDTPFRVIENEEFIMAVVDSEDRYLFGIYRATGKPYFPLNEMYHVEQNEEFFAVWLDTDDKILLGIRRDGQIIGEIHAVNALKQVITQLQADLASLQEKVGTIDTNLKELLDVFSLQDNEEYLAVEKDAEGKILSATNSDGSHYIHNAKSETIPEEFSHIEDPEGRTEITTDAENKILGYRDSEGTRYEHKISTNHINLSDDAAKEVNEAFKSAGIKMENPSDFSKDSHIELPIPRIAAQVRLYAPKLPTTKHDDIEAEIEYNDKDGNYFRKPVILNSQGNTSMSYIDRETGERGNIAIDINDGSKIKFGDFPTQDSFHLKKYYIDIFRGQCIVGYRLMEQVYKSRPLGKQYPYEYTYSNDSVSDGFGNIKKDFFTGAKCHPDGFPIIITWVNSNTKEETWIGIYTWNLKKSKEVYYADKKKAENIILDGTLNRATIFNGTINWSAFEIRNPKSLIDIDGNKYDGDNPKELSETDVLSKKVKDYIVRLSGFKAALSLSNSKETFEEYILVNPTIDYYLTSEILFNHDGFGKNWIWLTPTGKQWCPTLYDVDSIWGMEGNGVLVKSYSLSSNFLTEPVIDKLYKLYKTEVEARYKELRDIDIFTADNIVTLLQNWENSVGYENYKQELEVYPETPSYRDSYVNDAWMPIRYYWNNQTTYDSQKEYNVGDECMYRGYSFKAIKNSQGVLPFSQEYKEKPTCLGFYNSSKRVYNWLQERISYLDTLFSYTK